MRAPQKKKWGYFFVWGNVLNEFKDYGMKWSSFKPERNKLWVIFQENTLLYGKYSSTQTRLYYNLQPPCPSRSNLFPFPENGRQQIAFRSALTSVTTHIFLPCFSKHSALLASLNAITETVVLEIFAPFCNFLRYRYSA